LNPNAQIEQIFRKEVRCDRFSIESRA